MTTFTINGIGNVGRVTITRMMGYNALTISNVSLRTGGGGSSSEYSERLIGTVNGSNRVYATSRFYLSETTKVFINGILQIRNIHYTESAEKQITFSDAPTSTGFEDELYITYTER